MKTSSIEKPTVVIGLVALWINAVLLAVVFGFGTPRELLTLLSAASLLLVPVILIDARQTDRFSWPVTISLFLPGLNVFGGLWYSYRRFSAYPTTNQSMTGHGTLLFVSLLTAGLSLVVAPYLFGPVAFLSALWVRRQHDRPQGALLLAVSGVLILAGLLLHTLYFTFVRTGPLL